MKNNNALFYTCSLIEYIGRLQKLERASVVKALGFDAVKRIYIDSEVLHCEMIAKIADEVVNILSVPIGDFDNVTSCKYEVPDYWTIGEVYERLIEDVSGENYDTDVIIKNLIEVYSSWISDAISMYNSDFFYQSRDYIFACYNAGEVLE